MELVQNWCAHAKVEKFGGTGLIEQETGLPIGHHAVTCDHAPAGGMATWDLADAAIDFYDRNCVHCDKRQPVRLPNLSELVAERDREQGEAAVENKRREERLAAAQQQRCQVRDGLRAGQSAPALTLLDDLEQFDTEPSSEARVRILETSRLAPEIFSTTITEHFFDLVEAGEYWFLETGLQVLQQLSCDKRRLVRCALTCLTRRVCVEISASILEMNVDEADETMVPAAIPALALLARPPRSPVPFDHRTPHPEPLLEVFMRWPDQACRGVERLLDEHRPFEVMTGARSLRVLVRVDPLVPLRFVRSLATKLTRAHLLDEGEGRHDLSDVCQALKDGLALALLADPSATDKTLMTYFAGASSDGEARLMGVYERVFFRARRDDSAPDPAVGGVVLRRLLWAATTSSNDEVLREVEHAFGDDPDNLLGIALSELDVLLGAAALMDDRLRNLETDSRVEKPANMLHAMELHGRRGTLRALRENFVGWAVNAASGNEHATRQYIEFVASINSELHALRASLVEHASTLMTTPHGLNAVLPLLYSSMVGPSQVVRAAAAKALGKLRYRRQSDLPELIFEAFIPLLTDPYLIVHQTAVRVLEKMQFPTVFGPVVKRALWALIVYYRGETKSHEFLMNCIALFVSRHLDEAAKQARVDEIMVALIEKVEPHIALRELRYIGRELSTTNGFAKMILQILADQEAMTSLADDALELLHMVPATAVLEYAPLFEAEAIRWKDNHVAVRSFIEVLTRAGAWEQAVTVARTHWQSFPDTVQMRTRKWSARQLYLAVSFEAVIAAGHVDELASIGHEWTEVTALIEKDRLEYAERRDPLRGISRPHQGH
ncbi:hypothetical protein [Caballeronia mineralivorans]|uniref:hypothetical protein n=1 Tax=Caballeronia mineralivorans TaxID=2010198 RepID=UPI000A5E72C6|nr:hypothetical protein [Caballeronia mineralivorans]